jgi:hypothetical protein
MRISMGGSPTLSLRQKGRIRMNLAFKNTCNSKCGGLECGLARAWTALSGHLGASAAHLRTTYVSSTYYWHGAVWRRMSSSACTVCDLHATLCFNLPKPNYRGKPRAGCFNLGGLVPRCME